MNFGQELFHLLIGHQRRLEELSLSTDFPISLSLGHLLSELAHAPELSPSELARVLGVDPSIVSRWLKKATEEGLLISTRPIHDGRKKKMSLTKRGRALSIEENRVVSAMVAALVAVLDPQEVTALEKYFNQLAQDLGSPVSAPDIELSELARALRRLSRIAGLLAGNLPDTKLELHEFQLLLALSTSQEGISQARLAQLVGRDASRVSRNTLRLEKALLVNRKMDEKDARRTKLFLSSKGHELLKQTVSQFQDWLERACASWLMEDKLNFIGLLRKYTEAKELSRHKLVVERVDSDSQKSSARGFVATYLVLSGRANEMPAQLFDGTHPEFVLRKAGEIVGAIELDKQCYFSLSHGEVKDIEEKLIQACRQMLIVNQKKLDIQLILGTRNTTLDLNNGG